MYVHVCYVHDLFCICKYSFYCLFTSVLSMSSLVGSAIKTTWTLKYGQVLHSALILINISILQHTNWSRQSRSCLGEPPGPSEIPAWKAVVTKSNTLLRRWLWIRNHLVSGQFIVSNQLIVTPRQAHQWDPGQPRELMLSALGVHTGTAPIPSYR